MTTTIHLSIRLATPEDIPTLKALVESAYRGDSAKAGWTHEADLLDDERITDADLIAQLANPAIRTLVLPDGDGLLATVSVTHKGGGICYLGMLAVDPARQAGGTGRAMIAAAEATAREAFGATHMEMTVIARRAELVAYYQRRGYEDRGRTCPFPHGDRPDLPMVVLEKTL